MPHFFLKIKAELENVSSLVPASGNLWKFDIQTPAGGKIESDCHILIWVSNYVWFVMLLILRCWSSRRHHCDFRRHLPAGWLQGRGKLHYQVAIHYWAGQTNAESTSYTPTIIFAAMAFLRPTSRSCPHTEMSSLCIGLKTLATLSPSWRWNAVV